MAKPPTDWDTYEAIALGKFNGSPYSKAAAVGKHEVNFVTRIQGEIVVAPTSTQLYITLPDVRSVLQVALTSHLKRGVTLDQLVQEAFAQEMDTNILAKKLKALIAEHKTPSVVPNIQSKLDFKRLNR